MLASFRAVCSPSSGVVPPGCHNKARRKRSNKAQLRSVTRGGPCDTRTVLAGAAEAQQAGVGSTTEAPTIQDVYSAADRLLKERFGKKKHEVDQDKVQSYQREYFHACLKFAQAHTSDPQALVDLMACIKRARPVTVGAVIKEVERRAIPLAHLFTWEQAATLITTIHTCQPQFGGQLASKFCSRWTSQRGLRDLDASDNLQKLLNMFSVAASTAHASNEHARIIMRYLDTRQEQVTLPVVMGLTKALRDANILDTSAELKVLLQALNDNLDSHSNALSALEASSTDAALLLCRLDTLGLRPLPMTGNNKSRSSGTSKENGSAYSKSKNKSKAREEVPLAELLTRRLAIEADAVPPGLLVCATLASSTLLGYMHVPLVKATVRRLNDPSSVRLLDVGTLQAALQTLIASRQLASYNKLQGTIVRQALKQGSEQETRASQSDYLAARKVADSSPLPVSREALCGAVENVLSVLSLHMSLILDDEGLSTLPPPPPKLSETTRSLPRHLIHAGQGQPANVWISLLFDATRMDLWAVGHAALGRELIWSQAALMRVAWQVLAEEQSAAEEAPTSAPLPTPSRALQRLLWCHAHHTLPFPDQASHMVADMLAPRVHNLSCEEVSVAFWSIANLELRHTELAASLSTSVTRHLDQLNAEGAAHILGSMAALSFRDTWLVDSLCTVLLNRLHQGHALRPGLAVTTLSAIATYRVCPVKLVSELFNSGMFQRAGKGGKAPQRLRRLPYYALADVALAVADLHSHCSESLGKLPNILPVIKQATAEAISASPESFTADDLEKLRHFCVVTSHTDIVVDVMSLLKKRSAEQPPASSHPSLSRARTAELASFLASRRGEGANGTATTSTSSGYKHGQSRDKDLLSSDAPLPLAAVRSPSPHVGQAVVLEFDDEFCAELGLNTPVAMSDVPRPKRTAQPNPARSRAVRRKHRKVTYDSALQTMHSDSESASEEGAVDFTAALPSKPAVPTQASSNVFTVVDSKKNSAAELARKVSRKKGQQPKQAPTLNRPRKPFSASADTVCGSPFGAGIILPAGPGGSVRSDDKDESSTDAREHAWRDAYDLPHGKMDAFELAELEHYERLMRGESRYMGISKKFASHESSDAESDVVSEAPGQAVRPTERTSATAAPVDTSPLKQRPSHTPVQTEEDATLNQQAIEAAAAEFRVGGHTAADAGESTPDTTAGPAGASTATRQTLSAEEASLRDAAAWPSAAAAAEDATHSQPAATAAAADSAAVGSTQAAAQGTQDAQQPVGGAVSWLEQIRQQGKSQPSKKAVSITPKGARKASADVKGNNVSSSGPATSNSSQAGVKVSNGIAPSSSSAAAAAAAGNIPKVEESAAQETMQGSTASQADEGDVWTAGESDESEADINKPPESRHVPLKAHAAQPEATSDRSESGEIVFDAHGQPKVVTNAHQAKDVEQAKSTPGAAAVVQEDHEQSSSSSAQPTATSGTPTAAHASSGTNTGPANKGARKAAPRGKVAPSHSFFGQNAKVIPQPTVSDTAVTAAMGGKGARAAAVAKKAALAAQSQVGGASRYKIPHFDKFAKRESAVDMNLLTEITTALTPGTPLSSVASSPETAVAAAATSQHTGPRGDRFKQNKAAGAGTRFKQNRAATAATPTASAESTESPKPTASRAAESIASKVETAYRTAGSTQVAPQEAPEQAPRQVPSTAADAVSQRCEQAVSEASVPKEPATATEAAASTAAKSSPSTAKPSDEPKVQHVTAAAMLATESSTKSPDTAASKQAAGPKAVRAPLSASPSAGVPHSARVGPITSPIANSPTPSTASSSDGSSSSTNMIEEFHESPSKEFTSKLHGDEVDDFSVTNATGDLPRRNEYTRPTSTPASSARAARSTPPKAKASSAVGTRSTSKQSAAPQGSGCKAPTSAQSKLAEALRKGVKAPSMFDDGVDEAMLRDVEVDSDDDFNSLELDQTPPPPADPKQTCKTLNKLAAALQAAAANRKQNASSDTSSNAADVPASAAEAGGTTTRNSKLHADGRPLRARAPRANATQSATTAGPEASLSKAWRSAPASANRAESSWREAAPEPAPSSSFSQPSAAPLAPSVGKKRSPVTASAPARTESAAEAMRAAAEDLKVWEKAKTKAGKATAERQRAANRVTKPGGSTAAAAARERMIANMRARAEATKKAPKPPANEEDSAIGMPSGAKAMKEPPRSMGDEMRRVRDAVLSKGSASKKSTVTETSAKVAAVTAAAAAAKPVADAMMVDKIVSSDATASGVSASAEPSVVSAEQPQHKPSDHLEPVADASQVHAAAAEIVPDGPLQSTDKPADVISSDQAGSGSMYSTGETRPESSSQPQHASKVEAQFEARTDTDIAPKPESTSLVKSDSSSTVEEVEVAEVVGKEEYARKQGLSGFSGQPGAGDEDFGGLDMSRLEQLMNGLAGSDDEGGSGNPAEDDEMMKQFAEALQGGPGGLHEEELREMWQLLGNSGEGLGEDGFDPDEFEQFLAANGGMGGMGGMDAEGDGLRRRGRKAGQGRARRQEAKAARKKKKGFGNVGSR